MLNPQQSELVQRAVQSVLTLYSERATATNFVELRRAMMLHDLTSFARHFAGDAAPPSVVPELSQSDDCRLLRLNMSAQNSELVHNVAKCSEYPLLYNGALNEGVLPGSLIATKMFKPDYDVSPYTVVRERVGVLMCAAENDSRVFAVRHGKRFARGMRMLEEDTGNFIHSSMSRVSRGIQLYLSITGEQSHPVVCVTFSLLDRPYVGTTTLLRKTCYHLT